MLILLVGGARSGKSEIAESLAQRLPQPVTYIATLDSDESDLDLAQRIECHRARRPSGWGTVEATAQLPEQLANLNGTVLLDSLGPWIARHEPADDVIALLCSRLRDRHGDSIVVSDEVGMSVHPPTDAGRVFRDALGAANRRVAAEADQTLLVVAGRVVVTAAVDVDPILGGS